MDAWLSQDLIEEVERMLLEFDSDQLLWQETVRAVVAKHCPAALVRDVVDAGADPGPLWKLYLDQGWTTMTESSSAVELMIVLEQLGRACDPTPFLATMTQFAPLAGADDPAGAGAGIFDGVAARRDGTGWALDGAAQVLEGDRAERLAVVTGAGVFVVKAEQVSARRIPVFDPVLHVAHVSLDGVRVGVEDRVDSDVASARAVALTGLAATMVGACQCVLDSVVAHVSGRHQFGVPVGSFQAVAHKAADMYVAVVRARALMYWAALTIATGDPARHMASVMAKAAAGECQAVVFRHGMQLFGAMGYTWENDVQFALKRAKAGELLLGGGDEHRAVIAAHYSARDR